MDEKILQSEIDDLLTCQDSSEIENDLHNTNLNNKNLFIWDFKSENSQNFKNNLFNKFNPLFENYPVIFNNNTGKKIVGTTFTINEYKDLINIENTFEHYGSDFYTRKINIGNEELIEYVSPNFVNNILLESTTNDDNFIKKTIANHFIFGPLEKELSKLCNTKFSSQDIRLKNPGHIPYTDPIKPVFSNYGSNTLNLTSGSVRNLISIEMEYQCEEGSGVIFLAGNKNAWEKITSYIEKPLSVNLSKMKNHNIYSIFTSINVSDESIKNIKPGDTFITNNFDKFSKVPLIHNSKIIAEGDIVLDSNDKTGLLIGNSNIEDSKADYFENSIDNLFIITGSTYIPEHNIKALKKDKIVMFNTTITGLFPVLYNNKIVAQADVINYYSYPLIKIVKVEENPIDFSR